MMYLCLLVQMLLSHICVIDGSRNSVFEPVINETVHGKLNGSLNSGLIVINWMIKQPDLYGVKQIKLNPIQYQSESQLHDLDEPSGTIMLSEFAYDTQYQVQLVGYDRGDMNILSEIKIFTKTLLGESGTNDSVIWTWPLVKMMTFSKLLITFNVPWWFTTTVELSSNATSFVQRNVLPCSEYTVTLTGLDGHHRTPLGISGIGIEWWNQTCFQPEPVQFLLQGNGNNLTIIWPPNQSERLQAFGVTVISGNAKIHFYVIRDVNNLTITIHNPTRRGSVGLLGRYDGVFKLLGWKWFWLNTP